MNYYRNPETGAIVAYNSERNYIVELENLGTYIGTATYTLPDQIKEKITRTPPTKQKAGLSQKKTKSETGGREESMRRRTAILKDIEKGKMSIREIAEKHGCSYQTVYNIKNSGKPTAFISRSRVPDEDETDPDQSSENEQKREAVGPDRYKMIREAMHDKEFQSARYALVNKIPPSEVNAVVRSKDYTDYLDIRQ